MQLLRNGSCKAVGWVVELVHGTSEAVIKETQVAYKPNKIIMNKIVIALALMATFSAAPVFAAMPNETVEGYKQPHECQFGDIGIYEYVGSVWTKTGCVDRTSYDYAQTAASDLQENGHKFNAGTSVQLRSGGVSECPTWYNPLQCVISKLLII